MASEVASLARLAEQPEKRETSSSGSAVAVHPDQRNVHSYRMPQTLSTRMVPSPVEQGDTAVKEVLSGMLAEKLENAFKASQAADKRKERRRRHRSSKNKPDKSHRRQRGAKSSAISATANLVPSRSAEVANAATEGSQSQLQEDETKGASEEVEAAASRRSTRRKERSARRKRSRRHQLLTGESPKKPVVEAQPGDPTPLQPLARSAPPRPTHTVFVTGSTWNLDSSVVDARCSRLCTMMCALALLGCVAAATATLALSAVKVIGQRDRIMRDFNNWTLEQPAIARAAAVATTALAVPANSTWADGTMNDDAAENHRISTNITT
ncbi:hypothetical protein MTO96_024263 [Rhipicephalus appendiculatus]